MKGLKMRKTLLIVASIVLAIVAAVFIATMHNYTRTTTSISSVDERENQYNVSYSPLGLNHYGRIKVGGQEVFCGKYGGNLHSQYSNASYSEYYSQKKKNGSLGWLMENLYLPYGLSEGDKELYMWNLKLKCGISDNVATLDQMNSIQDNDWHKIDQYAIWRYTPRNIGLPSIETVFGSGTTAEVYKAIVNTAAKQSNFKYNQTVASVEDSGEKHFSVDSDSSNFIVNDIKIKNNSNGIILHNVSATYKKNSGQEIAIDTKNIELYKDKECTIELSKNGNYYYVDSDTDTIYVKLKGVVNNINTLEVKVNFSYYTPKITEFIWYTTDWYWDSNGAQPLIRVQNNISETNFSATRKYSVGHYRWKLLKVDDANKPVNGISFQGTIKSNKGQSYSKTKSTGESGVIGVINDSDFVGDSIKASGKEIVDGQLDTITLREIYNSSSNYYTLATSNNSDYSLKEGDNDFDGEIKIYVKRANGKITAGFDITGNRTPREVNIYSKQTGLLLGTGKISIEGSDNSFVVKISNPKKNFDVALRKIITKVTSNRSSNTEYTNIEGDNYRYPTFNIRSSTQVASKGTVGYNNRKEPVKVKVGDHVVYELQLYNEGTVNGKVAEITDYLPKGLKLVPQQDSVINSKYNWREADIDNPQVVKAGLNIYMNMPMANGKIISEILPKINYKKTNDDGVKEWANALNSVSGINNLSNLLAGSNKNIGIEYDFDGNGKVNISDCRYLAGKIVKSMREYNGLLENGSGQLIDDYNKKVYNRFILDILKTMGYCKTVEIECEVTEDAKGYLTNVAEITRYGISTNGTSYYKADTPGIDRDSEENNVFNNHLSIEQNIKEYEDDHPIDDEHTDHYEGYQDDDDFETLYIEAEGSYNVNLLKIDKDTNTPIGGMNFKINNKDKVTDSNGLIPVTDSEVKINQNTVNNIDKYTITEGDNPGYSKVPGTFTLEVTKELINHEYKISNIEIKASNAIEFEKIGANEDEEQNGSTDSGEYKCKDAKGNEIIIKLEYKDNAITVSMENKESSSYKVSLLKKNTKQEPISGMGFELQNKINGQESNASVISNGNKIDFSDFSNDGLIDDIEINSSNIGDGKEDEFTIQELQNESYDRISQPITLKVKKARDSGNGRLVVESATATIGEGTYNLTKGSNGGANILPIQVPTESGKNAWVRFTFSESGNIDIIIENPEKPGEFKLLLDKREKNNSKLKRLENCKFNLYYSDANHTQGEQIGGEIVTTTQVQQIHTETINAPGDKYYLLKETQTKNDNYRYKYDEILVKVSVDNNYNSTATITKVHNAKNNTWQDYNESNANFNAYVRLEQSNNTISIIDMNNGYYEYKLIKKIYTGKNDISQEQTLTGTDQPKFTVKRTYIDSSRTPETVIENQPLENGIKLLESEFSKSNTIFTYEITETYVPSGYVNTLLNKTLVLTFATDGDCNIITASPDEPKITLKEGQTGISEDIVRKLTKVNLRATTTNALDIYIANVPQNEYNIQLVKVDNNGNRITNEEATFDVEYHTDNNGSTMTAEEEVTNKGVLTLDSQTMDGSTDTYVITEKKAPIGYTKLTQPINISMDLSRIGTEQRITNENLNNIITLQYGDGTDSSVTLTARVLEDGTTVQVLVPNSPEQKFKFKIKKVDNNGNLITTERDEDTGIDGAVFSVYRANVHSIGVSDDVPEDFTWDGPTTVKRLDDGTLDEDLPLYKNLCYVYQIRELETKSGYCNIFGESDAIILNISTDGSNQVSSATWTAVDMHSLVDKTQRYRDKGVTVDVNHDGVVPVVTLTVPNPIGYKIRLNKVDKNGNAVSKATLTAKYNNELYCEMTNVQSKTSNSVVPISKGESQVWKIEEHYVNGPYKNVFEGKYIEATVTMDNNGNIVANKDNCTIKDSTTNQEVSAEEKTKLMAYIQNVEVKHEENDYIVDVTIINPIQAILKLKKVENNQEHTGISGATLVVNGKEITSDANSEYTETIEDVDTTQTMEYVIEERTASANHINILEGYQLVVVAGLDQNSEWKSYGYYFRNKDTGITVANFKYRELVHVSFVKESSIPTINVQIENPVGYIFKLIKHDQDGNELAGSRFTVDCVSPANKHNTKIYNSYINGHITDENLSAAIGDKYVYKITENSSAAGYINTLGTNYIQLPINLDNNGQLYQETSTSDEVAECYSEHGYAIFTEDGALINDSELYSKISVNIDNTHRETIDNVERTVPQIAITIPNEREKIPGKYEVLIKKEDTNGNTMRGVTFKWDDTEIGPTDRNGLVTAIPETSINAENVAQEVHTISEINVPDEYVAMEGELNIYINKKLENYEYQLDSVSFERDSVVNTKEITLKNGETTTAEANIVNGLVVIRIQNKHEIPGKYGLKIRKVDLKNNPLENVVFKYTENNTEKTTDPTDENGLVDLVVDKTINIENVDIVDEYRITEVQIDKNKYVTITEPISVFVSKKFEDDEYKLNTVSLENNSEVQEKEVTLANGKSATVRISVEGDLITLTIPNDETDKPGSYSLELRKVDQKGGALEGATFKANETELSATNTNGKTVVAKDVAINKDNVDTVDEYEISEINAPEGYIAMADTIKIYVSKKLENYQYKLDKVSFNKDETSMEKEVTLADGTKAQAKISVENNIITVEIPNNSETEKFGKYSLILEKVDLNGKKLPNVTFNVNSETTNKTSEDGKVTIIDNKAINKDNVSKLDTYTIEEINIAKNYVKLSESITVFVTKKETDDGYELDKVSLNKDQDVTEQDAVLEDGTKVKVKLAVEGNTITVTIPNKEQYFDLALRKWVTKAIVTVDGKTTVTPTGHHAEDDPEDVVKVDLKKSKVKDVTVKFEYSIRITNEGQIAGYAKEIKDRIPQGLKFVKEDNPTWKEIENNIITTDALKDKLLQPGESAEVTVVLTWINSETNMGVKTNIAEISKDYNDYGSPDIDSTPDNNVNGEDDIDDAPVMLTVKTGAVEILEVAVLTLGVLATITMGVGFIRKETK